ncbi:hypothetical protein BMF89_00245 [Arthrobacter sp. SRS-W-1-2016]|uniref:hypothetical protein n=1 Tax=Arthrobacter sp. SRS-W-1-2016 TaxID=1930254 RepID=UPI0009913B62|nr:hypothetical protein [Arthrobacter sp. SRS-W-1-2016]OOP65312.1 hypothetical protein BMF89_00245 [Arthrobacter sp. SRS-W-1-2016]
MFGKSVRRLSPLAAIAAILLVAQPASAAASKPPQIQAFSASFPAGVACPFPLDITGTNGMLTEITFKNGDFFNVGKGVLLTYTNPTNGESYTVNTAGSVDRFVQNADGTYTVYLSGHNGYVYFNTDATGPRVIEYTGRLVVTVDSSLANTLSVDFTSGQSVDVCAALS